VNTATAEQIDALLAEGHTVVVDFYATWCAPCKAYSPKFERIAREMKRQFPEAKVTFVSVDIDVQQDLARAASVRSVPTTVAYRMGRGLFGGAKRKEALRFSGDRSWPELVRTFGDLLAR